MRAGDGTQRLAGDSQCLRIHRLLSDGGVHLRCEQLRLLLDRDACRGKPRVRHRGRRRGEHHGPEAPDHELDGHARIRRGRQHDSLGIAFFQHRRQSAHRRCVLHPGVAVLNDDLAGTLPPLRGGPAAGCGCGKQFRYGRGERRNEQHAPRSQRRRKHVLLGVDQLVDGPRPLPIRRQRGRRDRPRCRRRPSARPHAVQPGRLPL